MLGAMILLSVSLGTWQSAPSAQQGTAKLSPQKAIEAELGGELVKVRRIYVESFGDDPVSKQLHDMVISALAESKRFIVTENKEKADAVLKGTGLEKTSQQLHATGEATAVGGAAGAQSGSLSGSVTNGTGSVSGSSSGGFVSHHAAIADSQASTETINDARLAVRLVSTDGDVIWTTTKESKGAKYKLVRRTPE